MEDLKTIFKIGNVIEFKNSDIVKKPNLKIVVKNLYYTGKEQNQSGINYHILDNDLKISSELMSQSWDALNVWFKVFKDYSIVGTYDFESESLK